MTLPENFLTGQAAVIANEAEAELAKLSNEIIKALSLQVYDAAARDEFHRVHVIAHKLARISAIMLED
ncbi:hypothetical protein E8L99_17650 [Phreatobacter aquaticus]|uniref:Uncharacterized protein n=1 Tax=Phreatobacter aquaticus TaxID=2570229 RepID=A0A4D7QTZ4_9HYPH|nr:hypothetical protein [Phreatobacter aquaticus]QCK87452.1 hypothetical protein E8L99_17650 [Phreatobacter aquaticus]